MYKDEQRHLIQEQIDQLLSVNFQDVEEQKRHNLWDLYAESNHFTVEISSENQETAKIFICSSLNSRQAHDSLFDLMELFRDYFRHEEPL